MLGNLNIIGLVKKNSLLIFKLFVLGIIIVLNTTDSFIFFIISCLLILVFLIDSIKINYKGNLYKFD